jgi:hypothetical protein
VRFALTEIITAQDRSDEVSTRFPGCQREIRANMDINEGGKERA